MDVPEAKRARTDKVEALTVDGGHKTQGGQVLRLALALSAASGTPMRVTNVRGSRPKPGLRAQHAAGVRLAAAMCGDSGAAARAEVGDSTVELRPGRLSSTAAQQCGRLLHAWGGWGR